MIWLVSFACSCKSKYTNILYMLYKFPVFQLMYLYYLGAVRYIYRSRVLVGHRVDQDFRLMLLELRWQLNLCLLLLLLLTCCFCGSTYCRLTNRKFSCQICDHHHLVRGPHVPPGPRTSKHQPSHPYDRQGDQRGGAACRHNVNQPSLNVRFLITTCGVSSDYVVPQKRLLFFFMHSRYKSSCECVSVCVC